MKFELENVPAHSVKLQPKTQRALIVVEFGEPDGGVRIKTEVHHYIIDTMARYVKNETGRNCNIRYDNYAGPLYWAEIDTE